MSPCGSVGPSKVVQGSHTFAGPSESLASNGSLEGNPSDKVDGYLTSENPTKESLFVCIFPPPQGNNIAEEELARWIHPNSAS